MEDPFKQISPVDQAPDIFQKHESNTLLEANSLAQKCLYSIKGWVKFLSVLGFLSFAVMLFYMYIMFVIIGEFGGGMGGGFWFLLLLLMLTMAVVIFMLALRLSKYSSSIGRLQISRSPADLESAMIEQMKFWRLTGILVFIILGLVLLGLISW